MKAFVVRLSLTFVLTFLASGVGHAYDRADDLVADEDVKPVYFEDIAYPMVARLKHVSGVVVVRLKLDDNGVVVSAEPISGAQALIPGCVTNAKKWRFRPNSTKSVILVYRFAIEGLCNLPCSSHFEFQPPNLAIIRIGEAILDHAAENK